MVLRGLLETESFIGGILNAMPLPVFVVDGDVRIIAYNQSGAQMLGADEKAVVRKRAGDILHCIHSRETDEGCGRAPACTDCIVRNTVGACLTDHKVTRKKALLELFGQGERPRAVHLVVTAAPFEHEESGFVLLVLEDVSELMELRSIVPICSYCKKIRNDAQYWDHVEQYIKTHLDVRLSHGICPGCLEKLYSDLHRRRQ